MADSLTVLTPYGPSGPVAIVGVCGAVGTGLKPGDVVVASELSTADGALSFELPGADMLGAHLSRGGLEVRVGPVICTDHVVQGVERRQLADRGALAVDMESVWLADGLLRADPDRTLAVVRVVVDAPAHGLLSSSTPAELRLARRRLAAMAPLLEAWAAMMRERRLLLAAPRSFCAGVERAVEIVERALDRFDPPLYVRREIIHNRHVVAELEDRGVVFVQELDEVPPGSTVVFAAHGVSPEVRAQATARNLDVIDATCPLVAKVHVEARRFADMGYEVVLIGHEEHEEVEGTVGEAPDRITVVASAADLAGLDIADPDKLAFLTQTTLAVDEVSGIVDELRVSYPGIVGPRSDDICYATQNRQSAVAEIAREVDLLLVVGSSNSSNSKRLVEVAQRNGAPARLVDGVADIDLAWLDGVATLGLAAGASAPEHKVQEIVAALDALGGVSVEERVAIEESVSFSLPAEVR